MATPPFLPGTFSSAAKVEVLFTDLTTNFNHLLVADVNTSSQSKLVYGSKCLMLDEDESPAIVSQSSPSKSIDKKVSNFPKSCDSSPEIDQRHDTTHSNLEWCDSHSIGFVRSSGHKDDPFISGTPSKVPSSKGELDNVPS